MTNPYFSAPAALFSGDNPIYAGLYPADIASADFNCDGHIDIVTIGQLGLAISFGNGRGNFSTPQVLESDLTLLAWPIGYQSYRYRTITVSDISEDGKPDIVIAFSSHGASSNSNAFKLLNIFDCPTNSTISSTSTESSTTSTSSATQTSSTMSSTSTETSTTSTTTSTSSTTQTSSTMSSTSTETSATSTTTSTISTVSSIISPTSAKSSTTYTSIFSTITSSYEEGINISASASLQDNTRLDSLELKVNIALGFSVAAFVLLLVNLCKGKVGHAHHFPETKVEAVQNPVFNGPTAYVDKDAYMVFGATPGDYEIPFPANGVMGSVEEI